MQKLTIETFDVSNENRIVAFIDVLGFRDLIEKKDNDLIKQYFSTVQSSLEGLNILKGKKLEKALLSDSIILSLPFDEESAVSNTQQMLHAVASLQSLLLQIGILTRGGISTGSLLIQEKQNIIVGTGLVNAYELEPLAKYPRVIIDPKFVDKYFDDRYSFVTSMNEATKLIYAFKGEWPQEDPLCSKFFFVNYISYYPDKPKGRFDIPYYPKDENATILKHIRKGIKNHKAFEKYNWLATYFMTVYPEMGGKVGRLIYGAKGVF